MKPLLFALAACVLLASGTGCHHNLARNGCGGCQSCGSCGTNCGACGDTGVIGGGRGGAVGCRNCGGQGGLLHGGGLHNGSLCQPGPLGWQRGGTNEIPRLPDHVYGNHVGFVGAGGPPTPTVGYPYYTTRGPRDFLQDNPPSIGR
ncbi:MAG: hypothetical protein KDA38_09410 [Planctomycetales bacterium]|nr:hypothetical protein [Planctomycetales bacterium]MCA9228732.1 hypothetical protein [Planctomycetales bacterium]